MTFMARKVTFVAFWIYNLVIHSAIILSILFCNLLLDNLSKI